MEPDSLVYQENFARSKRFIVPLLIGAIWGWLTGPTIVPSPLANLALQQYNRTTGHLRSPESNRTKRAIDEPSVQPGINLFNIIGFLFRALGRITHRTTPTFTPLSIQLLQASPTVVFPKNATRHKRHAETPLLRKSIEDLHDIIAYRINEFHPTENTWHPADIWLLTFTILNVFIGLLGVAYQHQTIIAILSKKPLTEGRDMKQDFSRVIHI